MKNKDALIYALIYMVFGTIAIIIVGFAPANIYWTPSNSIEGIVLDLHQYNSLSGGHGCLIKLKSTLGYASTMGRDYCNSYLERGDKVKFLVRRGRITGELVVSYDSLQRDMFDFTLGKSRYEQPWH